MIASRTTDHESLEISTLGRYQYWHGLHVLRVSGTDYEMGFQHGMLLREAIRRGPVPYYEQLLSQILAKALGAPLGSALSWFLYATIGRVIVAEFPDSVDQAVRGMADGAEFPLRRIWRGYTMPETYLWLVRQYMALRKTPRAPHQMVPTMGCTSVLAWGPATEAHQLLHGRTFDYLGVGTWDRETAVIFYEPQDSQAYVSVTSAGIHLGGITAMNEAGLTLVVHQHICTTDLRLGGMPVGVVGDQIMRHAHNLRDARRILDEHMPNGAWTYVVGSAHESSVLCYEVTSIRRHWFTAAEDTFAYTNMFLGAHMAEAELHLYPSYWRANVGRYHRVRDLLARDRGQLNSNRLAAILGDRGEGCRLRAPVAMLQTVGAVVFQPRDGIVYVATGRAPTSNRPFVAFDLRQRGSRPDLPPLTGGVPSTNIEAAHAFDVYREAYEAYFDREDVTTATAKVNEACNLQPREPLYHFVRGLLALATSDVYTAHACFDRALALGHPDPERVAAFNLWRGRMWDLQGIRDRALLDYQAALSGDLEVKRAAERNIRAPYKPPQRLHIEFTYADVLRP